MRREKQISQKTTKKLEALGGRMGSNGRRSIVFSEKPTRQRNGKRSGILALFPYNSETEKVQKERNKGEME